LLVPLGQAMGQAHPVPVGQADWDKLCLSQWDKHSLSQVGLGKVKRDLSLSHETSHTPTLEAFPCTGTGSIPTMELVPVPLVPTCPTKWVYKAYEIFSSVQFNSHLFLSPISTLTNLLITFIRPVLTERY